MRQTTSGPRPRSTVTLRELPAPTDVPTDQTGQVVFVTNAVRRRGGLRTRAEQQHHRPVLAAVVR